MVVTPSPSWQGGALMRCRSESRVRRSIERRDAGRYRTRSGIGWWSAGRGAAPTPKGAEASPASPAAPTAGSAKGGLANPLAPPGAPSLDLSERKKGNGAPAPQTTGPAKLSSLPLNFVTSRFYIECRQCCFGNKHVLL